MALSNFWVIHKIAHFLAIKQDATRFFVFLSLRKSEHSRTYLTYL